MKKEFSLNFLKLAFISCAILFSGIGFASTEGLNTSFDLQEELDGSKSLKSFGGSLLPAKEAFKLNHIVDNNKVVFTWEMPKGYYLYKDQFKITQSGESKPLDMDLSSNWKQVDDPIFGSVDVFYKRASAEIEISPDHFGELNLSVQFQGCASGRLCYPPETRDINVFVEGAEDLGSGMNSISTSGLYVEERQPDSAVADASKEAAITETLASEEETVVSLFKASASELSSSLLEKSFLWVLVVFFVLGLALTFTPCVLPMIPIVSSVVMGSGKEISNGRAFVLSLSYVLGMALTYTALGLIVGSLGATWNLQAAFQSPIALGVIAAIFALLSLSMFGVFDLKLPSFLYRAGGGRRGGSLWSAFVIGSISAIAVSPCVSAPLAGAMIYLSATGDIILSGLSLFFLSIGMGVPLILVGTFGKKVLPKAGEWMVLIKNIFGFMLLGVGIWLISRLIEDPVVMFVWGSWGLALSSMMIVWARKAQRAKTILLFLTLLVGVWSVFLFAGAATGASDQSIMTPLKVFAERPEAASDKTDDLFDVVVSGEELEAFLGKGRPVMVDIYADWCISCIVMEKEVFSSNEISDLKDQIEFVKLDISGFDQEHKAFLNEHGVFGPPAILFFDERGRFVKEATLQGEMDLEGFMRHMKRNVLNRLLVKN